jgi:hypothetical protein
MADHQYNTNSAGPVSRPSPLFWLRPRVRAIPNGGFQPIVVFGDGGEGGAIFGDGLPTRREAYDFACEVCEAAIPAGDWQADGSLA